MYKTIGDFAGYELFNSIIINIVSAINKDSVHRNYDKDKQEKNNESGTTESILFGAVINILILLFIILLILTFLLRGQNKQDENYK